MDANFPSSAEIQRRETALRRAMEREQVDALLVCGNQYAGFEGAVRYVSGFEIVHRYAYVLLSLADDPVLIFPAEARWVGDRGTSRLAEQVCAELPGQWIRQRAQARRWTRLGVYGMENVLAVRDFRELSSGDPRLVNFDRAFDAARAVKSGEELAAIRRTMEVITQGFWALSAAYAPGRTEAQIMAPAVERFFAGGAGSQMMNILLSGANGQAGAYFKVPRSRPVAAGDLLLYSLEIAGPEGYWVEFSRPLIQGPLAPATARMAAVYPEAMEAARRLMRDGEPVANVHQAAASCFAREGFHLGHLSGHSIGMTMLESPAIGANSAERLKTDMVLSLHPQVVDAEGQTCLYTQDTFRVGEGEGECLADIPWRLYDGSSAPGGAIRGQHKDAP